LKREAALIARAWQDVRVVIGGGDSARLERELHAMAPGIILSCGIAGALEHTLHPGGVVIDGDEAVLTLLRTALPRARIGKIVGGDGIVATALEKRALAQKTGAIAADMETHVARRVAERRGLPFGAIRVISDAADEDLPPAALVGMRPDGGMALGAVLWSLARRPGQLGALMRTGRQAGIAFRALDQAFACVAATGIDSGD
jgi:hypothetical protein